MKKDYIVLIVGESGSGKSKVCDYLKSTYGIKELKSYTTRPQRNNNDNSHTFVSDVEFDKLIDICAYTEYNGFRYCATEGQIDKSDIYIIDPKGVEYFYKTYNGQKIPMVVYISASENVRRARMLWRGEVTKEVEERIALDKGVFANISDIATFIYYNNDDSMDDVIKIGELINEKIFKDSERYE